MFQFSRRSLNNLMGVHPALVSVMELAIGTTTLDFAITEGLRTKERQSQLVAAGASKTMDSRHLTGHAVDIAPIVDGKICWDWPLFYRLASIVKDASLDCDVPIRWGGCWKLLSEISDDPENDVGIYIDMCKRIGRKPLTDGPHFELSRDVYQ